MVSGKVALLIASLFLMSAAMAGCSGKGGAVSKDDKKLPEDAGPGQHDAETCSIEGTVVDDEQQLIPGVQVGVLDSSDPRHETLSAENGEFSLSYVKPGTVSLAAVKTGYNGVLHQVACEADTELTGILLELVKKPDPAMPFRKTFGPEAGWIGCGFGWQSVSLTDPCKQAGLDQKGKTDFSWPPENGTVTGAVYELRWQSTAGALGGKTLQMTFQASTAADIAYETNSDWKGGAPFQARGTSILYVKMWAVDGSKPLYLFTPQNAFAFTVRPAGSAFSVGGDPVNDGSTKLITSQAFELAATLFYNGEPMPENYSNFVS